MRRAPRDQGTAVSLTCPCDHWGRRAAPKVTGVGVSVRMISSIVPCSPAVIELLGFEHAEARDRATAAPTALTVIAGGAVWPAANVTLENGETGIRTPDTGLTPYNGLANRRLQPLGHLSGGFFDCTCIVSGSAGEVKPPSSSRVVTSLTQSYPCPSHEPAGSAARKAPRSLRTMSAGSGPRCAISTFRRAFSRLVVPMMAV